jgi:hypothetical protein
MNSAMAKAINTPTIIPISSPTWFVSRNLLKDREYYVPTEQGVEGKFKARLAQIKEWKKKHR